jgi:hypothetical protein
VACKKSKKRCQTVGTGTVQNDEDSTSRDQLEDESMMDEEDEDDPPFENMPLKTDHFRATDSPLETDQPLETNPLGASQPLPYGETARYVPICLICLKVCISI